MSYTSPVNPQSSDGLASELESIASQNAISGTKKLLKRHIFRQSGISNLGIYIIYRGLVSRLVYLGTSGECHVTSLFRQGDIIVDLPEHVIDFSEDDGQSMVLRRQLDEASESIVDHNSRQTKGNSELWSKEYRVCSPEAVIRHYSLDDINALESILLTKPHDLNRYRSIITQAIDAQLYKAELHAAERTVYNIKQRILRTLVRYGTRTDNDDCILSAVLSRYDIADIVGTRREVATRKIKELEGNNVLEKSEKKFRLNAYWINLTLANQMEADLESIVPVDFS